jgi:hypothetical protein
VISNATAELRKIKEILPPMLPAMAGPMEQVYVCVCVARARKGTVLKAIR